MSLSYLPLKNRTLSMQVAHPPEGLRTGPLPRLFTSNPACLDIKRDSGGTLPVGARRRALLQLPGAALQTKIDHLDTGR